MQAIDILTTSEKSSLGAVMQGLPAASNKAIVALMTEPIYRSSTDSDLSLVDDRIEDTGIVAFDFDGTLTVRDSFVAFLRWRCSPGRYLLGLIRLAPKALLYLANRDRGKLKAAAVAEFLRGMSRDDLEAQARAFAEAEAPRLLRPDAVQTWRRWRQRQAKLVIVTASPDLIVAPFARGLGCDVLIATELALDSQERLTGGFSSPNCRGPEKVRRLRAMFGADMRLKAAYGDTRGDREMLRLADDQGYKLFRQRP